MLGPGLAPAESLCGRAARGAGASTCAGCGASGGTAAAARWVAGMKPGTRPAFSAASFGAEAAASGAGAGANAVGVAARPQAYWLEAWHQAGRLCG